MENIEQAIIAWIDTCGIEPEPKSVGITLGDKPIGSRPRRVPGGQVTEGNVALVDEFCVLVDVRNAPRISSDNHAIYRCEAWLSATTESDHYRGTVWDDISTYVWKLFECCKSDVRFSYAVRKISSLEEVKGHLFKQAITTYEEKAKEKFFPYRYACVPTGIWDEGRKLIKFMANEQREAEGKTRSVQEIMRGFLNDLQGGFIGEQTWSANIVGVQPLGVIRSNMNDRSDRHQPAMRMFNIELTVQVGD